MQPVGASARAVMVDLYTVSVASAAALGGFFISYLISNARHKNRINSAPKESTTLFSDSPDEDHKMVILVRSDINMGRGKAAAQCCHAALAAYQSALKRHPAIVAAWEAEGQPKVTLKVESVSQMEQLQSEARQAGLIAESVRDAGRTQLTPGTKTVCAIGPGPARLINLITGHLKLY